MAHDLVRFDFDQVKKARDAVMSISGDDDDGSLDLASLIDSDNLNEVESGIRKLNKFATKSTLLSAILLYNSIFCSELYSQSGLPWSQYVSSAKERLGIAPREISEMLAAAGFFIENNSKLMKSGYKLSSFRNLSRAYLALKLSGNVDEVVKHLCSGESAEAFKAWYQSLKKPKELTGPSSESIRTDIVITKSSVSIGGKNLFSMSETLPEEEKEKFMEYVTKIYSTIQEGKCPAVIPVYDKAEARKLVTLRDKNRKAR